MLMICTRLYIGVYDDTILKICLKADILYTSRTVKLFNKNTGRAK
jgi:hypothetical protein